MSEVLVSGSLHLDVIVRAPRLPRLDETLMGRAVSYRLGGKGGNQAIAAARMGARTAMAGCVGSDGFADRILRELDHAGVDHGHVTRKPGESGMSVAIVEQTGSYAAVVISAANLLFDPPSCVLHDSTRVVCLQNEVPEAANRAIALAARRSGVRVILNAAPARSPDRALMKLVDVLVVNRIEAESMSGDCPPRSAARELLRENMEAVIVTLGAEGLVYALRGEAAASLPAFTVRVDSTHGAGDMFVGALAAELSRGVSIRDALPIAQAAAALQVSTPASGRCRICRAAAVRLAEELPFIT